MSYEHQALRDFDNLKQGGTFLGSASIPGLDWYIPQLQVLLEYSLEILSPAELETAGHESCHVSKTERFSKLLWYVQLLNTSVSSTSIAKLSERLSAEDLETQRLIRGRQEL